EHLRPRKAHPLKVNQVQSLMREQSLPFVSYLRITASDRHLQIHSNQPYQCSIDLSLFVLFCLTFALPNHKRHFEKQFAMEKELSPERRFLTADLLFLSLRNILALMLVIASHQQYLIK